jgi:hypothetical protein
MALRLSSALALIVLAATAHALAAGHGSLYVSTLPPGATVWIDGAYMGETPLFVDDISGGRHVILLTRAGWQPVSTAADVTIGRVVSVSAVLEQNPATQPVSAAARGLLRLRDTAGTKVSVDGSAVSAPDNALSLPAGRHILEVIRGKQRSAASFTVYPNTTTTISLAARQIAAQAGSSNSSDTLAALSDYVPAADFTVNGDDIIVHVRGIELECSVGSLTYTLNGKVGTLTVAPEMVGNKPFLPVSLLNRIAGNH